MERGVGRLTLEKTQEVAEEKHPADGRRGPGHPELPAATDRLLAAAEQEPDSGAVDDPRGSQIDRDRTHPARQEPPYPPGQRDRSRAADQPAGQPERRVILPPLGRDSHRLHRRPPLLASSSVTA